MSSPPAVSDPEGDPAPPPVARPQAAPPQVTSPTNPKGQPKGQPDTFENMATLPVGRAHQPPSGVNVPTPTVPPSAGAPREGASNPVRTGSADDVEKNNSTNKEVEALKGRQAVNPAAAGAAAAREEKRTSLFIILSFVYAKLLVVICIAYVVSEIITAHIPLVYYEAFFTYLYGASILFLLYVFCFLLQESACCSGGTGAEAAARERRKIAVADQKKREKDQVKAAKDKERADKDRARKEKKDKETQEAKQAKDAKDAKTKAAKDAKDAKAKAGKDQKGGKDPKTPKDAEAQPPPPPPQPAQGQQPSKHATFYQKQEGYPRKMRDLVRSKQQEQHRQGPLAIETDRELEQPLLLASHQDAVEMEGGAGTVAIPERSLGRKRKTTQNNSSHGSFFLRVGAIAFGLGTMIYNGLEFGTFFETPFNSPCYQILRGINPILQMIFTFMQMYFIFMNSRLNIHRFKVIARFGLMHVVATNLCVWIRTLVLESLKEIMAYLALSEEGKAALVTTNATPLFFNGGVNLAENFRLATSKSKQAVESTVPPTAAAPAAVRMVQTTARTLASTAATTLRTTATTLTTLAATTATTPTTVPTTSTTTALPTTLTTPTTMRTFPTEPSTFFPFSMLASSTVTSKVQPSGFSWHGPGTGAEDAGEPLPRMEALIAMKFNMSGQRMLNSDTCDRINIMGNIVQESAPYLFPFVIEYCLIGAAVVYIMWKHIGRNPRYVAEEDLEQRLETILSQRAVALARAQQGRVDCVGASKGLFFGLLLLVFSIICLILFFVLVRHPTLGILAIYLADVSHSALMAVSILALIIGFISNYCCDDDDGKSVYPCELQEQDQPQQQDQDTSIYHDVEQIVQGLKFKRDEQSDLNDILLRVSAFGLFIYAVFSIIAGSLLATEKEPNLLILVTGALSVLQVVLQLLFIADVSRRRVYLPEHDRSKPGRQVVTFLLICNIAMWIIYTFEMQKVAANPVQLDFYGYLPWAIVQRITLPMCVFHRFHSAVTLAEIWKTSYKAGVE